MNGSPTRRRPGDEDRIATASGQVSMSDAIMAIKNLDRHAFARRDAFGDKDDEQQPSRKTMRVSDAVTLQNASESGERLSRFSQLSGVGQLHRERARQRKKASSQRIGQTDKPLKADAERSSSYRPFSLAHLLQRLSSFSIATYSGSKPGTVPSLTPLGMAMKGWSHAKDQQRDGVQCDTCSARWVVTLPTMTAKEEQEAAWRELELRVEADHQGWCPWRIRSCDASLYRIAIRSLPETQAEVSAIATEMAASEGIETVSVSSDITSADLAALSAKFPTVPLPALTLALLGWQPIERGQSVQQAIITCRMCARRAGLWSYTAASSASTASKTFDAVREHKSYCPVINGEVQSGRWLVAHKDTMISAVQLPAYRTNVQLLLGTRRGREAPPSTPGGAPQEHETRNMRSHEILSKVKGLLDGNTLF